MIMTGRRWSAALLTGATHGIGAATARRLAGVVDVLLLHGPEPEAEVSATLEVLRREHPAVEIAYFPADFGHLAQVDALVAAVLAHGAALDLVVNNAGRPGAPRRTISGDGHELTFQTNYLALVAITTGLLDRLREAPAARVIELGSQTHYSATLALEDPELEHGYSAVAAYASSKLAIVTYTKWLARRLDGTSVEVACLHPGVIATELLHAMFGAGGAAVDRGASNIMALVEAPPGVNGAYFEEDVRAAPNPQAADHAVQDRLATLTAERLGIPLSA
jgi:NAD(P)-dependent dehydrogenase (short-subunit alcohol dehydrogenase family)